MPVYVKEYLWYPHSLTTLSAEFATGILNSFNLILHVSIRSY